MLCHSYGRYCVVGVIVERVRLKVSTGISVSYR